MIIEREAFRLLASQAEKILPPSISWDEGDPQNLFLIEPLSNQEKGDLASHLNCLPAQLDNPHMISTALMRWMQERWQHIDAQHGPFVSEEEFATLRKAHTSALLLRDIEDVASLGYTMEPDEQAEYDGWEDNGGEPDGNACLIWPLDHKLIRYARDADIQYEGTDGFELDFSYVELLGQEPLSLQGIWSGIQCSHTVFACHELDAVLILRTERYITEHYLHLSDEDEMKNLLPASLNPSNEETLLSALQSGKDQVFNVCSFDVEKIGEYAISQAIRRYQELSRGLLWKQTGDPLVYQAVKSSPLQEDLVFLASIANGTEKSKPELVEKVREASTRVISLLCGTTMNPDIQPSETFWQSDVGQMIRHVQHWLYSDDLINYTTAAEILWGTSVETSVARQRIQRMITTGKLTRYVASDEANPRHAQRVSRAQVLALKEEERGDTNERISYNEETDYYIHAVTCDHCRKEYRTMVLIRLGSSDHTEWLCMQGAQELLALLPKGRIVLRTCDRCHNQVEEIGCITVPILERRKMGHIHQESIQWFGGERDGDVIPLADDGQIWCPVCVKELLQQGQQGVLRVYDSMTMDDE